MYKVSIQDEARRLRATGYSVKEIARELDIAQSSASVWVREVKLSKNAEVILEQKRISARKKASHILHERRVGREEEAVRLAQKLTGINKIDQAALYLICSMIYECEGGKGELGSLEFTNSDPVLVAIFLKLLRSVFPLDESKFRVVMHLHSYHNEKEEKEFWSRICGIPKDKFLKTYQKKESGIRRKSNYRGCVQIKYFDVNIKRVLLAGKKILANNLGL